MKTSRPSRGRSFPPSRSKGQIIVIYGMLLPILFLFLGLGIDTGLMYLTKAKLSRAVDATALRMVRKFDSNTDRRKTLALQIMRTNLPGFLPDVTYNSGGWVKTGNISDSTGETLSYISGTQQLIINTISNPIDPSNPNAAQLIRVTLSATQDHYTYFMPIAGDAYRKMTFNQEAQAERYPSVNVLVIDTSGSMLTNGGASALPGAVKDFVNEFDDLRDYMMVVSFSSKPHVIWPTTADEIDTVVGPRTGLPYTAPSQNFKAGISDLMDNYIAFTGNTSGGEAFRLGAENLEKWLVNKVPTNIRPYLMINYVLMTDGEYNSFRTYYRGRGFGQDLNGNNIETAPALSIHNTFHSYMPVVGRSLDFSFEGKNISTIFGSYGSAANMPGINAQGYLDSTSSGTGSRNNNGNGSAWTWVPTKTSPPDWTGSNASSYPQDWQYLLLTGPSTSATSVITSYATTASASIGSSKPIHAQFMGERVKCSAMSCLMVPQGVKADIMNPYLKRTLPATATGYSASLNFTGSDGVNYKGLAYEVYENYNKRWDLVDTFLQMDNERLNYYPLGAEYANHAGSYERESPGGYTQEPNQTRNPWLYPRSSGTTTGWWHITARMSDYYPDYTIYGNANVNGDNPSYGGDGATNASGMYTSSGGGFINRPQNIGAKPDPRVKTDSPVSNTPWQSTGSADTNASGVNEANFAGSNAKLTQWWRFSTSSWQTNLSTSNLTTEHYFLARAQAYGVRRKYDSGGQYATIYTIVYGNAGSTAFTNMQKIANDPAYPANYTSGQTEGKYYRTTENPEELKQVFHDIASRIAVRLAQ